MRLTGDVYDEMDGALAGADTLLERRYPGERPGRQPVHTVYVPADKFHSGLVAGWGRLAQAALEAHPPLPFAAELADRVVAKLAREPIEDLRVDFEDGYGVHDDADEDAAVRAAASILKGESVPFVGIRIKSLEQSTRRRAVRTWDMFLDEYGCADFVVTVPKVSVVEQVEAAILLCGRLERAYGLPDGVLRFELQVETPAAVLGADGVATVARMVHAAQGRCVGLHYGTYDYTAALGVAAAHQSMDHPAADYAKAVMQVAAAGTGVRVCDGSTNVLPVGDTAAVHAAWRLHTRLVRRSLERGFYQGWDLHPAQLPTRYAATYAFFREGIRAAVDVTEPAAARALARFVQRGLDCGALDPDEVEP